MTVFQRFARSLIMRSAKYAGIPLRDPVLVKMFGDNAPQAGEPVDEDTALNYSAVWAAVNLLAGTKAGLPMEVYDESKGPQVIAKDHPVRHLLRKSPNPEMTPFVFHETGMAHCLTWGNTYKRIEWLKGIPVALWPILPDQMLPDRDAGGNQVYHFMAKFEGEKDRTYQAKDIIHVPGLGYDGLQGYSVIQRAKEAISMGLATELFGASFFGNGTLPIGFIEHPGDLEKKAQDNVRESWESIHRGPRNSRRVAVLDEGMKFTPLGIPPGDAQFLETRQFQIVEIARWFNVPPHMLRDLSNATYSNIEQQSMDFLVYSLRPWLIRFQQEYERKLFTPLERQHLYIEHEAAELQTIDMATRFNCYKTGRDGGWYSLNDIMKRENMPLLDAKIGDVRLMPINSTPIGGEPNDGSPRTIQDTAMNGIQVTSILGVLTAVAGGQLAAESAKAVITIAFPHVDASHIDQMLAPYKNVKLKPPEEIADADPEEKKKLRFNQDQPRVPAGNPDGGQWAGGETLKGHVKPSAEMLAIGERVKENLTSKQKVAIYDYTQMGYKALNAKMRECPPGYECLSKKERKLASVLTKAIKAEPPFPKPIAVYRGIDCGKEQAQELIKKLEGAKEPFGMLSITSTSLSPAMASNFSKDGGVVFRIMAKTGLYINAQSLQKNEQEVLKSHKSRYTVTKVEHGIKTNKGTTSVIHLEEV